MVRVLKDWLLTPFRLAIHEPSSTALLADVHLGYGDARRRAGDAIPHVADSALSRLVAAHRSLAFRRLLIAGDWFERRADAALIRPWLQSFADHKIEFLGLVVGNHDRGLESVPQLPIWPEGFQLDGWNIQHETEDGERTVQGHWHPSVRWQGRKVPSFVVGTSSLILPAFSSDAAGARIPAHSNQRFFAIVGSQVLEVRNDRPRAGTTRNARRCFS